MPDREVEAHVQREVAPRSFELITNDGVIVRRNQRSVRRLPEKPQEQLTIEDTQEEHSTGGGGSQNQEPNTQESAVPEIPEPTTVPQPTEEQPQPRTSSQNRKPIEWWEPTWASQR